MANNRPIYIGTHKTTDAERAEIEAYNASLDNQQSDVYVDYNAAEAEQQQNADYLMNAAVNPAQQQIEPYWTPQRINQQYVADMANPNPAPDEIRPGNVSRDAIRAANEYYKIKFNNAPVTEWKADPLNDLYYQNVISKSWGDPNLEVEQSDPLGEIIPKVPDYGTGKYEDMPWIGKLWHNIIPGTSYTSDSPSSRKYTQGIVPAVTSAGGGAALGSLAAAGLSALGLATPVGWAATAGAGLVGAASYVQSAFDVKIPVLNSVLEGLDIMATKTEQLWRTGELYIHKGEVENAGQFIWELAKFKIGLNSKLGSRDEYNARMAAASTMYETKTTGLGDTLMDLVNRGYNVFADKDVPISKPGEAYMYNRGLMTPQEVMAPEGVEATDMLTDVVKEMVKITNPETQENYTYREAQDVIQQWAYDTFGSTAFLNELVESSVFDPANLIPFISAYAVKKIGKATGNVALVTAADLNVGNPLIDALPPVIQNIAEIAANKIGMRGSSKSIFSTLDTYKNVLRYGTKLDAMSLGQMKQANLTPEGKFAEYQPTDITGRRGWLNKLISETPESKAMGLTALTSDMVTAVHSISPDYESFKQNIVALASDTAPDINSPISGIWGTAAHKTILDNLKTIIDQGDYKILFDLYEQTAGNRAALADISNALGKQQKDVITLAQDKPEVLKQMINDYAVQHDGKLGNLIIDDGGTNAVDMLQMYTGKNPQAWNENILRFEVTTKIADSLSDMLIEQYGIKADNVAIRLSKLMKKAQSGLLLGFSPSYITNNLINNIVTRASVGAIGGVTLDQYRTFMENAGIFPARFAEDAGILRGDSIKGSTPYGKAAENISDVKRKGDWIDKAGDTFGKTKKFSLDKLNSVIESTEGQRAYGAGIMQFFHRVWKPDNGFRRMDKALETMIEMQSPGLSNLIYSTISQYFDMASIERALYASMLTPDASEVLTNIGKRLFPNDPYVISEIFDKAGITNDIQNKMRSATTRAEREQAIRDIYKNAETYRDRTFANEMVNMAEAIGNIATAEGLPAVHEILTNMAILEMDHWINNRADFTNTYDTKVRLEIANDNWRKLIGATVARQANDYKNFNAMRLQTYDGIIRGLGFSELEAKDFIRFMGEQDAVYRDFFAEKTKLLKEAYRKTEQIDSRRNIGKSKKDTQIEAIWDNFNYETQTLYKEAYQNERRLTINRNEIFVQAYEKATGADGSQLTTLFDQILSTRDEMHEKQIEMHQWTAEIKKQYKNDYTKRDQVIKERYDTEFNPYYNQKIQDIRDLNQKVIDESQKDGFVARAEYGYSQPKTSEPKILRDQIIEAIEVQNIGKAAENGRTDAQMTNDNFNAKENIRSKLIESGIEENAVDTLMAQYDEKAKIWNRRNPDKRFYSEIESKLKPDTNVKEAIDNALKNITPDETLSYEVMFDDYALSLELGKAAYGRMVPETLRQHAMLELNREILKPFESLEHAEIYLKKMDKPYTTEKSYQVDQQALSEAINTAKANPNVDPFSVKENTVFKTVPDGDYQFEQTAFDDGKPIRIEYAEKLIKAGYDPDRLQTLKENLYEAVSHDLDDNAKEIAIKSVDSIINSGLLTTEMIPMSTLAATEVWQNKDISQDMKMYIIENITAARISIYEIQKEILAGENIRDGSIPPEGIYMRRSQTSQIGSHEIVADVFNDGQFVAYYPYGFNTELVTLSDGTQVRPLGISGDNPDVYVYIDSMDGIHEVNVDKPHGYENAYVQSEGETLVNRGTPVGATPMIEPDGSANSEILNKYIYPVLDEFIAEYEKAYNDGASKNLKQVDQDTRVRILKYLDDVVKPDMASAKFNAMKFGEFKRDAALLNYSKTYGFDSYLTMISPYQFWYTRSMLNWAKRLIDKPAYLTAAMRYRALAEKNKKEEYPYRLNNLFRIPLAGLPDWMGGGTFVDILSQTSPFLQFLSPVENMLSEQNTLNKKAYSILDELIEANEITGAQKIEAIRTKDNDLWRTVIAQAKLEYGKDPSVKNLFDQYLSPPLWLSWAKNIYQGKGSEIGMLPITRFGNTVGTLADDTFLEGFGQIAKSALTAPEKGLRKIAGLDYKEFGEFENYNIWKQIMQMIVDGDIEVNQGLNAMVEMKGDIYNEAVKRQREENAIKTQGALPIYEMKRLLQGEADASIGGVMASLILTPLGSKVFPSGEKGAREMQAKLDQAYIDKDNGDKDAVSRFWRENPEYYARLASFKDSPEEMMRYVLHTFSKNFYYSQPKAQQQAILNNYGPEFYQTIIDPSTSNWREADIDKMAVWAQGLTGNIPDVERFDKIRKQQQTLQFYAPQVVSDYDLFLAEQDRLFPGQSAKKKAYYALDKTQKSAYRKTDPLFDQYLTWEWEYKKANPNVKTVIDDRNNYYDEVMAYDSFGDMPESVVSDFDYWAVTGKPMRGTTMRMLHNLYDKYADPNYNTFEQYLDILKQYR
jgi:hypothetical protein